MVDGIFNSNLFNREIFNTHLQGTTGIIIGGTHSGQQLLSRKKRRPEILIPVEFTFRIIARTFITHVINQLNIKQLVPVRISQVKLDEAFSIPLTALKNTWQKALKKESLHYMLSSILLKSDKVQLLKILKEMFKR